MKTEELFNPHFLIILVVILFGATEGPAGASLSLRTNEKIGHSKVIGGRNYAPTVKDFLYHCCNMTHKFHHKLYDSPMICGPKKSIFNEYQ